ANSRRNNGETECQRIGSQDKPYRTALLPRQDRTEQQQQAQRERGLKEYGCSRPSRRLKSLSLYWQERHGNKCACQQREMRKNLGVAACGSGDQMYEQPGEQGDDDGGY